MELTKISDQLQNRTAKIIGFTLLFSIAIIMVANYGVSFRLVVPDVAETAKNIVENIVLFRMNIAANLLYCVVILVMISSLYVLLKSVNWTIALIASFFRLIYAISWAIGAVEMLNSFKILTDKLFLETFTISQVQVLSRLHFSTGYNAYYVGLPFWGLASVFCCYLWLKSGFISRILAIYGLVASAWCVFCAFAFIVVPHFDKIVHPGLYDVPMVLFEIILGFRLLFKKVKK